MHNYLEGFVIMSRKSCNFALRNRLNVRIMSIDTYKLTSMEEPTDEVLSQLMREVAEEAARTNAEATERFFEEIKQAAAAY